MQPLRRGVKYMGVGKICDIPLKSPFISETVRDRPMIAMERQQDSVGGGSISAGSDDLK